MQKGYSNSQKDMHINKMQVKLEYQLSSGMRGRLYGHVLPFAKIKISKYMILLRSV